MPRITPLVGLAFFSREAKRVGLRRRRKRVVFSLLPGPLLIQACCYHQSFAMPDSTRREIQVEVPADVVARQTETILEKYQKLARLPGFRRGRVPQSILRQRFAEEIKSEVVEALVPRYFRQEAERG